MVRGQLRTLVRHLRGLAGGAADGLSDRQLLERFAAHHDGEAFAALVRRHGGLVLGACWRVLHQADDVEDAFQATFLVLARKAGSLPWRDSVAGWLYEVAHRVALKARAERGRRRARERDRGVAAPAAPAGPAWRDLAATLDEELRGLAERYRAPLLLCYLEGLTRDEAAGRLGWSVRTLKRRLARGLELLRGRLTRRGATFSSALLVSTLSQKMVPAALAERTARTAALSPADLPGPVARLVEGGVKGMATNKSHAGVALLAAVGLMAGGAGLVARQARREPAHAAQEPAPARVPAATAPARADLYGDPLPRGAVARLGTVRFRHGGTVRGLAFFPDRKLLASAGQDNAVRLWDLATGKEVRCLVPVSGLGSDHTWVNTLAVSPDGKRVAAGTGNGPTVLVVWEAATGRELLRLSEKQRGIVGLAFTPDGRQLIASDVLGALVLWDAETGQKVRDFKGHEGWIEAIAVSPNGKLLASACRDKTARLWDPRTGKELRRFGHDDMITSVALSPDGRLVATGTWGAQMAVWETATGREVQRWKGHDAAVSCLAFLGDGRTLASGSWDRTVRLWDARTGKRLKLFEGHAGPVPALAVSPDDRRIVSGSWDHTVKVWDLASGKDITSSDGHRHGLWSVALSPDGKLVATGADDRTVRLWDAPTGRELRRFDGPRGIVDRVQFSADGKVLSAMSWDHTVRRWDVATGKTLVEHRYGGPGLVDSPDGKYVAGGGVGDRTIRVWERATGKEVLQVKTQDRWVCVAFTPDGTRLAAGSEKEDGTIVLWDVATGKEVRRFQGAPHMAYALAISPDGRFLAGGMANNRQYTPEAAVHLWDLATGKELLRLKGHTGVVSSLVFSADSRTLASSGDGTARLWEVSTGRQRRCFTGHQGIVFAVGLSGDGRRLATAGHDTTALVWDVTGPGPRGEVTEKDLEVRWAALEGSDAEKAYDAAWWLAAVPGQSVPYLAKRLRPVAAADAKRADRLVADLDSKSFAVRKRAAEELGQMGEGAVAALRKALEGKPAVETRRRAEELLEKLTGQSPEYLQTSRAVEVLEMIGSREARALLEKLVGGLPGARLTEEAAAARARLGG